MLKDHFKYIVPSVVDPTFDPEFLSNVVGIVDLNNDDLSDIILLGAYYPIDGRNAPVLQESRILLSSPGGSFNPTPVNMFPAGGLKSIHGRDIVFADFNNDGRPDIFLGAHGWDTSPFPGEQNRLILSSPSGTWDDASSTLPQLSDFTHAADTGDYDNDGDIDIFVGNGYSGQNAIAPYLLINNGAGIFELDRSRIPTNTGQILDPSTQHMFPGVSSSDIDGDGNLDLIITADFSEPFNKNKNTTILWGNGRDFNGPSTALPETVTFVRHIDLDAAFFDIDGDGDKDVIICGTQGSPFYDGYFIQILRNDGGRSFTDVTAQALSPADTSKGVQGVVTSAPTAAWVRPIDFDHNGHMDFAIEYGTIYAGLSPNDPLVWLNDGTGKFNTLKVKDFVGENPIAAVQNNHIYISSGGYSFLQMFSWELGTYIGGLTALRPYMAGTAVADRFISSSFNDTVDGSGGRDIFSLTGKRSEYAITGTVASLTITDLRLDRDGTDSLMNIERLRFSDDLIAFDIDGNAGTIYRIYQAAFARSPDKGGISYWINQLDTGLTLRDVAYGFVVSNEFKAAYGANPSSAQLVEKLYQNVLGRAGEKAGVDYWVGLLEQGTSVLDVVAAISESSENKAKVANSLGLSGIELYASYFPL